MKLEGKVFITGEIVALTGLHIGGSKSSMDIGGLDLNVIKTPEGEPYIPGSSLKGKLRSLLARVAGTIAITQKDADKIEKDAPSDENNAKHISEIFGLPGDETTEPKDEDKTKKKEYKNSRLIVRDADLLTDDFGKGKKFGENSMEFQYSDIKWENTINRKTGTAEHPRQLERVPAGARFKLDMVYDVFDDKKEDEHLGRILEAMRILQGDYLGGQGSRGYGKIEFKEVEFRKKSIADFADPNAKGTQLTQYKI